MAKFQVVHWRKYGGLSPIGEIPGGVLAKVRWTFAIGESPIGESLIGEIPVSHFLTIVLSEKLKYLENRTIFFSSDLRRNSSNTWLYNIYKN